jgi:hypothetical protein
MESTMTKHVTVPVPEVPGIDLTFRPRTYFGPIPAATHVLARVAGHERREVIRAQLAADDDDPMLDLLVDLFEGGDRESLGRIHPALMGGEYLPPFLSNETEIARISLESTTADQITVRAQRLPDGIAYRIVDEYEDMSPDYECHPSRSQVPLTLAELIALIDGSVTDGGAALSHLYSNVENSGEDPWELRNFVRVHSEFYREIGAYYDRRVAAWFAENHPVSDQEEHD